MKNPSKSTSSPEELAARKAVRDEELRNRNEYLDIAERPIIVDLSRMGFNVNSVWDLKAKYANYDGAISILLKHIVLDYPDIIKEGIARALAVPAGKSQFGFLISLFESSKKSNQPQFREGLASAISELAGDEDIDQIIRLITDESHGEVRLYFVVPLMRSKLDKARVLVDHLSSDPTFAKEIKARRRRRKGWTGSEGTKH
ncbi:hypothetical protein E9232_003395 [Inquilinus ginsengisoli]|uniref:HEAT repeat domain-containing protein n=1 Tax=Inquilinus ginsengisoli TaxID=363840 RepID=A0ABU1JTG5_9PROT|nr:hypothetical protein [Inquilinus ginsengisoli]MDR6290869.1 hypothetical protein [Inquilinus ginsengisoli]